MRRHALIIGSPIHANVWLSFVGPAAVGVGIALRPGTAPIMLVGEHIAGALIEEIRAISDGVPETIGVLEIMR